jgi:hypothetical protein
MEATIESIWNIILNVYDYLNVSDIHYFISALIANKHLRTMILSCNNTMIIYINSVNDWVKLTNSKSEDQESYDLSAFNRNKKRKREEVYPFSSVNEIDESPRKKNKFSVNINIRNINTIVNKIDSYYRPLFLRTFADVEARVISLPGPRHSLLIEDVLLGKNIFITGGGGTGKSEAIKIIKSIYGSSMQAVAFTGPAAKNIQGKTLHSFFSLNTKDIKKTVNWRLSKLDPIFQTEILVIDEISMVGKKLLEQCSEYCKLFKNAYDKNNITYLEKHFAGIQVILVGDFFQLPPIDDEYCFNSFLWNELNMNIHILDINYRQSKDTRWKDLLNNIRICNIRDEDIKKLNVRSLTRQKIPNYLPEDQELIVKKMVRKNLQPEPLYKDYLLHGEYADTMYDYDYHSWCALRDQYVENELDTILYTQTASIDKSHILRFTTRNITADKINKEAFDAINSEIFQFISQDSIYKEGIPIKISKEEMDIKFSSCKFEEVLRLKIGTRVMLLVNIHSLGLCNGSLGTVVDIIEKSNVIVIEFDDKKGITVNIPKVKWEKIEGTKTTHLNNKKNIGIQNTVHSLVEKMKKIQSEQLSSRKNQSEPSNSDLMDTIQENYQQIFNARYIDPAIEKSTTGIIITREQFPLTYGWAFSIHKSQGLTINKAIIDVENCFDIGQAYVALSRVQTYNGLFLEKEVHAKEIKVSNEVKVFYRNLLKNK